eukprot:TRINITY_DN3344_c2_g1_i2.p1 TRINITY_DN3344_c2_g1~~TRINITY_DN3344_c2_g1_i2.p1  ORF type:complete len:663 (+),score=139.57 TRINITY_DN3344_c2_g1_i2:60-1991(+)
MLRQASLRWCSRPAQQLNALVRDHKEYFNTVDDLMYLYSPTTLSDRAKLCLDIAHDLKEMIIQCNDEIEALNILDTMSNTMCLLLDPSEATRSTHPSEAYRNGATDAFNYIYRFMSELNTSRELYAVLVNLVKPEIWNTLTPIQKRNTLVMKADMDTNGIHLPREQRDKVVHLSALREELAHHLVSARDSSQQQQILEQLLAVRHQSAELLGFKSFAHWTLEPTMAETPENAWRFINTMSELLQPRAKEEVEVLLKLKEQAFHISNPDYVTDYEQAQLSQLLIHRKYGESHTKYREYLSVANVWRGLQMICEKLFGVFVVKEEMESYEKYHPTIQKYVLYDNNKQVIGKIYADLLDRPDKMRSASHFTVQLGTKLHSSVVDDMGLNHPKDYSQKPIVIFSCNGSGGSSSDWNDILVTPDEMVTIFHEFGHSLHTMFGNTEYHNLSGTRSSMDYVEALSQFFEYLARDYRVVKEFAFHHKTGEPVPEDLVENFKGSERSFGALDKLDQLILCATDLSYHGERPMKVMHGDTPIEVAPSNVMEKLVGMHVPIKSTNRSQRREYSLAHMSNYPAAYYSYMYSKVIAAAIWNTYFNDDPFNAEAGSKLRSLMSMGASEHPRVMLQKTMFDHTDPAELLREKVDIRSL